MAANSSRRGISGISKRVVTQIWTPGHRDPTPLLSASSSSASLTFRRGAHASVYDKNPDDQIHPSVVPDEVIQPQSDKYWAPHPQTGVFGPAAEAGPATGRQSAAKGADAGKEGPVLEEKAWFRPTGLEDLEKPLH